MKRDQEFLKVGSLERRIPKDTLLKKKKKKEEEEEEEFCSQFRNTSYHIPICLGCN